MTLALLGFAALFALLFFGVPIALGMLAVGLVGFAIVVDMGPSLAMVGQVAVDTVLNYSFSVLPLFILMGNFIARSRLSDELFNASNAFLGHHRGGLAMATILACGGFSAVCGSSLATAATMSRVAIPPMMRHGYAPGLATASVAAGGTLGILIPPSVVLVLYGIMTEADIGKLFIAGILPGVLGIVCYVGAIAVTTRLRPQLAPAGPRLPWTERLVALKGVWGVLLLVALVMGGIYLGVFTATEAAGIGATGAFVFALARRTLGFRALLEVLAETGRTTAMMFMVLIGALVFSNFIDVAGMPEALSHAITGSGLTPAGVILVIVAIYLVLGCVLDTVAMILLTVPLFYPIVSGLGYDAVWFGILVVVVAEIGLITPPIGLNVYMIRAMVPQVPAGTIFRGVTPFILADLVRLALILALPGAVLFLPGMMK